MATEIFTKENVNENLRKVRESDYAKFTDPMFMQVQRGEITNQQWLDEIQKIKNKYPYVEADVEIDVSECVTGDENQQTSNEDNAI